jgi:Lipopolysaccharide kinase (Kdo/WaaP) family.
MSNLLIQDNENIIIYADDLIKDINEDFFETNKWLQSKSYDLTDTGRGETIFFEYQNLKCVLKHYFRGGILGGHIRDRYLWTGIDGSRSIREFRRLEELSAMGLPVPKPIGARVKKSGATYTADLITIEIENSKTLSELIIDDDADNNVWKSIGKVFIFQ